MAEPKQTHQSMRRPMPTTDPAVAFRFGLPVPPVGHVRRPRLLSMLERGASQQLTLVSAPAGTGKTTLVADWASRRDTEDTAWITFESGDGHATAFWSSVFAQLHMHGVSAAGRQLAPNAEDLHPSNLIEVASDLSVRERPLSLVLDGWEFTTDDVAGDFDFLLRHSGGKLGAIIITRSDPLLPLHRYRLNNLMTEVRIADLAFTVDEVRALAETNGLALTEQSVRAVTTRTRGWVTGLRFAIMYLKGQADPDAAVIHLAGDTGNIGEYLVAEVLELQSEADRDLLLNTCIVDVLQPGLVDELGGRGASRGLARLSRGNAFLERVADQPGWYRYHPFFRDLLRAELEFLGPDRAMELHRRAGRWLAEQGTLVAAVCHAKAAREWGTAAQYVVDDLAVGAVLLGAEHEQLAAALRSMPATVDSAAAAIVRAAVALSQCDSTRAAGELVLARSKASVMTSGDPSGGTGGAQRLANDLIAALLSLTEPDAAVALAISAAAECALERQSPDRVAAHPELVALVSAVRGRALLRVGHLREARVALATGADVAEAPGCEYTLVYCLSYLALLDAHEGALHLATDRAKRALALVKSAGLDPSEWQAASLVATCYIALQQGDAPTARKRMSEVSAQGGVEALLPDALLSLAEARLARSDGDLDGAIEIMRRLRRDAATAAPWVAAIAAEEQVECELSRGSAPVDDDLLRELSERTDTGATLTGARLKLHEKLPGAADAAGAISTRSTETLVAQVTAGVLAAEGELQRGNSSRARALLEHASRLAAPEGLRWPFQLAAPGLKQLLPTQHTGQRRAMKLAPALDTGRPTRVTSAHHSPQDGATLTPDSSAPLIDSLTAKELEVLNHLSALLTTEEIASTMFVSVNTVRTHVRSILRKLSVSRRHQAVRRARALDIIGNS
jgi:LuxR family maltose regulon positive regulatory protein